MNLDIRNCLELRAAAGYRKRNDELLEYLLESENTDQFPIVCHGSDLDSGISKLRKLLGREYELSAMFDLGSPFLGTTTSWLLVVVTKIEYRRSKTVKIANWNSIGMDKISYELRKNSAEVFDVPQEFSTIYKRYIEGLEQWWNEGHIPADDENAEFVEISQANLSPDHLTPRYYSNKGRTLRKQLKKEQTTLLTEVADVITVIQGIKAESINHRRLKLNDATYPFNLSSADIVNRPPTNVILKKGDIIFPLMGTIREPYLLREEPAENVYAPAFTAVIRTKDIKPEYLFLYLTSETGLLLREIMTTGAVLDRLTIKNLCDFPVILPRKPDSYYVQLFETTHYKIADYSFCYGLISDDGFTKEYSEQTVEELLDSELTKDMKTYKDNEMNKILEADVKELNICFANGAYKATLILAGSILEAVLIDWLSEIKGRNFFDESEVYIDGRGYEVDTLAGYINEIKYLKRPKWFDEADKAFAIKDKRNLVHAKLYIKEEEIGKDACEMVIDYLKDVIASRNKYSRIRH